MAPTALCLQRETPEVIMNDEFKMAQKNEVGTSLKICST
jgi:hypothetical protein